MAINVVQHMNIIRSFLADSGPLPTTLWLLRRYRFAFPSIQNITQDVKAEFREFQAELFKVIFSFVSQDMASLAPETGDWLPDSDVCPWRISIDVTSVCNFSTGARIDAMHFRVSKSF